MVSLAMAMVSLSNGQPSNGHVVGQPSNGNGQPSNGNGQPSNDSTIEGFSF